MLDDRREESVRQVEDLLGKFYDTRVLTSRQLSAYGTQFSQGWEVPRLCGDSDYNLRILLPADFPFDPPRVAVSPAPPILAWPNLEEEGLLCLLSESASFSTSDSASVVLSLLDDAQGLVKGNIAGEDLGRFEDEFQSYWTQWQQTKVSMGLLCRPERPSRWVSAWHGKLYTFVAENEAELQNWLLNRYGKDTAKKADPQSVPLIWLPRPPHPSEYPANVSALMSLLHGSQTDRSMVEQLLLEERAGYKTVVLGFKSRYGTGFAGLQIHEPKGHRRSRDLLTNGFRGQPPASILLMRYGAGQIVGAGVTRYDRSWIHGRDENNGVDILAAKSVVVIGVGSLGSTVAELLAKAGVHQINLIDHGRLEPENVGRHVLGVSSVGEKKAKEMTRSLTMCFPHLKTTGYTKRFERFAKDNMDQLLSADLIVSATGSWRVESLLNTLLCRSEVFPPVMSGWLEPHAAAGHAIVCFKGRDARAVL